MTINKYVDLVLKGDGYQMRAMLCMENAAELSRELSKFARGEGKRELIVEKLANLTLSLKEMKEVFAIDDIEVESIIRDKVDEYEKGK